MSELNYQLIAAGHFLYDSQTCSMEYQLEQLEKAGDTETASHLPDVIVWNRLEGISVEDLLHHINVLASNFEEIYKIGEFDGYEKIKNLIVEKQYETKS